MRKYLLKRAFNKKLNMNDIVIEVTQDEIASGRGPKLWGWAYGTSDYMIYRASKL